MKHQEKNVDGKPGERKPDLNGILEEQLKLTSSGCVSFSSKC